MAIQQPFVTNFGLECHEAYHRVTSFSVDMLSKRADIGLATYINKDARISGAQPVSIHGFVVRNEPKPQIESDITVSLNLSEITLANTANTEPATEEVAVEETATNESVAEGEEQTVEQGSEESIFSPTQEESTQEEATPLPLEFRLDFNGDGVSDIVLKEGLDFGLGPEVERVPYEIVKVLNENLTFSIHFFAEVLYQNVIRIKALSAGDFGGSKGNALVASGQIVTEQFLNTVGSDFVQGDYDRYFSTQDFEENSIVTQCYNHIKRLSNFSSAMDV